MTDINNINNIARQIVSQMDTKYGQEDGDGIIEASIWNKFVCKKQGNEISNYITTDNALKSVIAYLKREVTKTGQAIEDVANEWLKNVGGGDKGEINPNKTKLSQGKETEDLSMSYIEADSPEEQERINNANQLLADVATGKYRYKIEETEVKNFGAQKQKTVRLADGRYICVRFKADSNSIDEIAVSTNDKQGYVWYNSLGGCGSFKGNFESHGDSEPYGEGAVNQYNKDDLLKIIQKIFGDDIEV